MSVQIVTTMQTCSVESHRKVINMLKFREILLNICSHNSTSRKDTHNKLDDGGFIPSRNQMCPL